MLIKPIYEPYSLDVVDQMIEEACAKLRADPDTPREVFPSGLDPQFRLRAATGLAALDYWRDNIPISWLTEEEAVFDEAMLDGVSDDHPLWDIYDRIHDDIVKWIEWEFNIVCLPHQAYFLRSPATRKILRVARRSGKTWELAFKMIHFLYTNPQSEVILVCPSDEQVRQIFTMMQNFMFSNHPERWCGVKDGGIIVSERHNPAHVLQIKSHAPGVAQNTGATSELTGRVCSDKIRGKGRPNVLIVFDEFDFIENQGAIDAVMNITIQPGTDEVEVIVASTPSGKRGKYYFYCTDRAQGWEEHQWTAWEANQDFTLERAIDRVTNLHWNDYLHDVEADFGEEAFGWIRKLLIDEAHAGALGDFFINKGPIDHKSPIRTMGVDWDKMNNVGPSFVIVEFHRILKKMVVVHSETMPVDDHYTFQKAVKRIIDLNTLYNPHYIYVDRGYGESQIEQLHAHGEMYPDSGLREKVKGISFSSKVACIDYSTGEKIDKLVKQVMASEMLRWFEEHRIVLSEYDIPLIRQLENFRVVKLTQLGYKFNEDDEHLVDALMLAIHAVSVKFDELFQRIVPPVIISTDVTVGDLYGLNTQPSDGRPGGEWNTGAIMQTVNSDMWPDGNYDARWTSPPVDVANKSTGKIIRRGFTSNIRRNRW